MEVGGWPRSLGLAQELDSEVLPELSEGDLEKLGVPLRHRKRLLKAISALGGATVAPAAKPSAAIESAPQESAEHRHLTVMFCDLVGSTALSAQLDPEDMREIVRVYQNTVAGEITRFDGDIAKFMGDGIWVRNRIGSVRVDA